MLRYLASKLDIGNFHGSPRVKAKYKLLFEKCYLTILSNFCEQEFSFGITECRNYQNEPELAKMTQSEPEAARMRQSDPK